jgi:hypothetical protein
MTKINSEDKYIPLSLKIIVCIPLAQRLLQFHFARLDYTDLYSSYCSLQLYYGCTRQRRQITIARGMMIIDDIEPIEACEARVNNMSHQWGLSIATVGESPDSGSLKRSHCC